MSWGVSYTVANRDLTEESDAKLNQYLTDVVEGLSDEAKHQVVVAMLNVITLIESGAIGDPAESYNVTISGHANPNHERTPGWSNDGLSISIYQTVEG